jgi:membrane protease YdiL (CAAX protease family)
MTIMDRPGQERTMTVESRADTEVATQYTRAGVLAVWAAAALPMAALAWVVAPAMAGPDPSPRRFAEALIGALTAGLVWQFALVWILLAREGRRPVRDALWLRAPSTATRSGGRLWLWAIPFTLGFLALVFLPIDLPSVASHDFGAFLGSDEGRAALRDNWPLFAAIVVMLLFNTVLGEEFLFRGLLLPRMRAAFGRADWIANAVLFGTYHLHQPWSIPTSTLSGLLFAYPSKRFRSAWLGILVHSSQSLFFTALLLRLVLG